MAFAAWWGILNLVLTVALLAAVVYLFVLIVRALKKYIGSKEVRAEKRAAKRTLGETLKAHRIQCHMTQEFVAESLGVSRQTVSKWENGSADPSTTNLLAVAKLYDVPAEELLREVERSGGVLDAPLRLKDKVVLKARCGGQGAGRPTTLYLLPQPQIRQKIRPCVQRQRRNSAYPLGCHIGR